jgi:hypothetical protein
LVLQFRPHTGPGGSVLVPVHLSRLRAGMIPSLSLSISTYYTMSYLTHHHTCSIHCITASRARPVDSPHHNMPSPPDAPRLTTASPRPLHAHTQPKTLPPHTASRRLTPPSRPLIPVARRNAARRHRHRHPAPSFRACASGIQGPGVACEAREARVQGPA